MPSHSRYPITLFVLLLASISAAFPQESVPVKFTLAVSHEVRRTVRLPGTVESPTEGVVASEAAGLVIGIGVEEGQTVRRGQPLVELRRDFYELRLRAAQGRLNEALSRLDLAERKLARARSLFDETVISQDGLDDAFSDFTAWQAREDQSRAEIGELELYLDRCTVRAPYDGVVTRKRTDLGRWMEVGGEVFEMAALDFVDVRIDVPEQYFRLIRPGVEADVSFEALPGLSAAGLVRNVVPSADPRSRTFPVKIRIPNPEGQIGAGMLARVSLPVGESYSALVVPKDALVRQGAQELIFFISDDDTVEPLPVESGQGVGSWVVVEGALEPGQRVITRGNERVRPGQSVRGETLEYPLP